MLKLPEIGFQYSVKQHNCDLAVACDWIEASLLFGEEEISSIAIADILQEQQYYLKADNADRDLCGEFLEMLWTELDRRRMLMGAASYFQIRGRRLIRTEEWTDRIPLAFLLTLSCCAYYSKLRSSKFSGTYVIQGSLFEEFCEASLANFGWRVYRTGWSSKQGAKKLHEVVKKVAAEFQEVDVRVAAVERHKDANEAGCDLVCSMDFKDEWIGRPVLLVQCASGQNYHEKLRTPDLQLWGKFIDFSTQPMRGFCTPYVFEKDEFRKHCDSVRGVLIDRWRLLEPVCDGRLTLQQTFSTQLKKWIAPRVKALPVLK